MIFSQSRRIFIKKKKKSYEELYKPNALLKSPRLDMANRICKCYIQLLYQGLLHELDPATNIFP